MADRHDDQDWPISRREAATPASTIGFRGLDARLLLNWTDVKFRGTNGGIDPSRPISAAFSTWKVQYTVNRHYDVFLNATNLTDVAVRTHIALNGPRFFKTNQGVLFIAGVRGRF